MILVTGGAGYIGSHCVLALQDAGYDVVVFDNLSNGHRELIGDTDFVQGDLQNLPDIKSVFESRKIDACLHFAAKAYVNESVTDPQKYYYNNVYGTMNLLNAMMTHGCDKIVFSSTCAIYGEAQYLPLDEKHPQNPVNPYGQSKLMIENILDDYDKAYNLKSVRFRYFNVAGACSKCRTGEWHEPETHLIPNVLKAGGGKVFEMYGDNYDTKDGTCIRDYVNVEDLCKAHILGLKYLLNNGKTDFFNLGTGDGNSVKEVFSAAEKITGRKIPVKICLPRAGDPAVLVADNKKVRTVLGWQPEKTLDESIRTAYQWELSRKH